LRCKIENKDKGFFKQITELNLKLTNYEIEIKSKNDVIKSLELDIQTYLSENDIENNNLLRCQQEIQILKSQNLRLSNQE